MSKKKIIITGGSGFIGTNLINYLIGKKYKIINIDKLSYCSTKEKYKSLDKNNYKFFRVDIADQKKIKQILTVNRFSTIVNLASESHVDRSIDNTYKFIKSNILSTTSFYNNIRDLIKKGKIKSPNIIHISTDEVFGSLKKGSASEKSSFMPNSPYSASKASTEHILRSFSKTFGMRICILRLCNNYGPYQFTEKFIPTCITKVMDNISIPLYGDGKNIREWMYVKDSCSAIELLINHFANGEDYNLGSGLKITNLKLIKLLEKGFKKKIKFDLVQDRPGHDKRYSLNSKKFFKKFKWKPKYNIDEGINETIQWYAANKEWLKETLKNYRGNRQGLKNV